MKRKKDSSVVMWQGIGIVRKNGAILTAYSDSSFALAIYEALPLDVRRRYHLALVTARLERVTKRQVQEFEPIKGK